METHIIKGAAFCAGSPPHNPADDIEHDGKTGHITITIGHPYHIPLNRLKTHADLFGWVAHLSEKGWMTAGHMGAFILAVCEIRGWKINMGA